MIVSRFPLSASRLSAALLVAVSALFLSPLSLSAQIQTVSLTMPETALVATPATLPADPSVSSSTADVADIPGPFLATGEAAGGGSSRNSTGHILLDSIGAEIHLGINGIGMDFALPVARKWNVRVGGQYIQYTGHFTSDGAQIDAALHLGNGKAGVDWFPFNNGFHISPQMYFAIQTDVNGTVIVPAGSSISLDGGDYVSSTTNPLTGTAHITTRKAAPGLAIGWGNISPRGKARWSFPVEIGFYYIGQPTLNVTFKGTACDPTEPPAIGCEDVTQDAGFQKNLAAFIARNNNNLSYASFFPVAQFGVGYRF